MKNADATEVMAFKHDSCIDSFIHMLNLISSVK